MTMPEPGSARRANGGPSASGPSIAELIRQLAGQMSQLLRQEVSLARAELARGADSMSVGATRMALGAAVSIAGMTVLLGGVVYALALVMPLWLAAIIVGGVVTAAGLALLFSGRAALKARALAPKRTVRSLKEGAQFIKEKAR